MLRICTFFQFISYWIKVSDSGTPLSWGKWETEQGHDGHNSPEADIDGITVLERSQFQRVNCGRTLPHLIFCDHLTYKMLTQELVFFCFVFFYIVSHVLLVSYLLHKNITVYCPACWQEVQHRSPSNHGQEPNQRCSVWSHGQKVSSLSRCKDCQFQISAFWTPVLPLCCL